MDDSGDAWLGREVGSRYQLQRVIGQGGMGRVYEALDLHQGRTVALKLLHSLEAQHERARLRFESEARAAAAVPHVNVVEIYDFGELRDGTLYIVLEHLDGVGLDELLRREGRLEIERALRIARQVNEALGVMHGRGVVHRDLKPSNIMLVESREGDELVKVLDFGLAKFVEPPDDLKTAHTAAGQLLGTPHYLSPEQARGATEVGHPTDVYALGVILFEALTGRCPFESASLPELLVEICHGTIPDLRELRSEVPESVAGLVAAMLDKDGDARVGTGVVGERLSQLAPGPLPQATASPAAAPVPKSKGRGARVGLGLLVLVILVGGSYWALRSPSPPASGPAARPEPLARPGPRATTHSTTPIPSTSAMSQLPMPARLGRRARGQGMNAALARPSPEPNAPAFTEPASMERAFTEPASMEHAQDRSDPRRERDIIRFGVAP